MGKNNYEQALETILKAKEYLEYYDEYMGAYVYLNLCVAYMHLDQLEEAYEAFTIGLNKHRGRDVILEDYLTCGMELFQKLHKQDEYKKYRN